MSRKFIALIAFASGIGCSWLYPRQGDTPDFLSSYENGQGFGYGDILSTRDGKDSWVGPNSARVIVIEQSILNPSTYTVIAEDPKPRTPKERYIKFDIDGHDFKKIGHSGWRFWF